MKTPQHEMDLRVLTYVYDNDLGMRGGAGLAGLRELVGNEEAATSASGLRERGLIRNVDRQSGGYHVTALGRTEVESLRARQSDRGHRRSTCREQFLRWIDANSTTDSGGRIGRDRFHGSTDLLPFTDEEIAAAATHLADRQLIKSISAAGGPHILVWISEKGRDCVDEGRGIQAFLDKGNGASQVFHVSGSGNSIAAAVGDNNDVTADLSGFDLEIALRFAAAVREAAPVLALPPEVDELIRTIESNVDVSLRKKATHTLYRIVEATATGALGGTLGAVGAHALGIGS